MKKWMVICLTLLVALTLAACGGEESTTVMQIEENGVLSKITLEAEGDEVVKQTADNIITYAALGLNSKEEAEAAFGEVASSFQGIDGVTHSMDYQDDQVTETLIVDYGVADFEEVAQLEGSTFDDTDADYISLEKTIELLEDQGFEQVE